MRNIVLLGGPVKDCWEGSFCFLVTCFFAFLSMVSSNGRLAFNCPNPQLNPHQCGRIDVPENASWVCDPDSLLEFDQAERLDHALESLKWGSRCDCDRNCSATGGYQIAIALVRRIGVEENYIPDRLRARDFAEDLREEWFHGDECQVNAVLFYALTEKEFYISIGSVTSRVVSDIELGRIYHHTADYFHHPNVEGASGDSRLYEGLVVSLTELHEAIDNHWYLTYGVAYVIIVASATVVLFATMCFIANCSVHYTDVRTENAF